MELAIRRRNGNLQAASDEMLHAQFVANWVLIHTRDMLRAIPMFELVPEEKAGGLGLLKIIIREPPLIVDTSQAMEILAALANCGFAREDLNLRAELLSTEEKIHWGLA